MPNTQTSLSRVRLAAQVVTVGSALLLAVVWLWTVVRKSSTTTDSISQVLGAVTVLGGVCMGLLYAFHRWSGRNNRSTNS